MARSSAAHSGHASSSAAARLAPCDRSRGVSSCQQRGAAVGGAGRREAQVHACCIRLDAPGNAAPLACSPRRPNPARALHLEHARVRQLQLAGPRAQPAQRGQRPGRRLQAHAPAAKAVDRQDAHACARAARGRGARKWVGLMCSKQALASISPHQATPSSAAQHPPAGFQSTRPTSGRSGKAALRQLRKALLGGGGGRQGVQSVRIRLPSSRGERPSQGSAALVPQPASPRSQVGHALARHNDGGGGIEEALLQQALQGRRGQRGRREQGGGARVQPPWLGGGVPPQLHLLAASTSSPPLIHPPTHQPPAPTWNIASFSITSTSCASDSKAQSREMRVTSPGIGTPPLQALQSVAVPGGRERG